MGHIPEDGDPFKGNPEVPQQGTRLDIDGQTNAESSEFKTRLQSEISDGDAKLGQEITRQGEELGGEIAENTSRIEKVAGSIEGISDGIASSIDNIEKDLKFLTGDKDSEFTAEVIKSDITDYLAEQAEAIKIIKSGDGAAPGEAEYARLWLSNFGETYSAIHFLAWKLKDFSNVVDDLDSSQMEQYSKHVEKLRKQLVSLYSELEQTDVNKPEYAELEDKITDIVEQFERITDIDELYPEDVTKRIATLEKGIQYFFDIDTNAFDEFKEILETRALGIGVDGNTEFTGEYYRVLHDEFREKADEMRAILDMAQKAEEDGVELDNEDMFNYEKAVWFRNTFTLTSTLAAVFSYDDWRDRLNQVDFKEDVYRKYVDFISSLKKMLSKFQSALEGAEKEDEIAKLEDEISKIDNELSLYTCETNLDSHAICQAGHFAWYLNEHDTNENSFRTGLAERALGIGVDGSTEGTGEYYRVLNDEFKEKAAEMKAILDMADKADEDGVELDDEDMFNYEKAVWFRNTFTLTSTLASVFSYDDWRDRLNQVDFREDVYKQYVDYIDMLKQLLSKVQRALEGAEKEDEIAKLEDEISKINQNLSDYTCETNLEPYAKCQAGHFAWYLNEHNTDEESYRAETKEEIGLNPVETVTDLEVNKTVFKLVTEEAIAILKSPIGSHPESVVEAAKAHIDRFGKDSNSTVAYSEWQNYVLETNVSDAVGEILNTSDCISERLVSDINEAVDNVSIEEALIFPFPDGNRTSFNIVVEGEYKVILVTLNGLIQNGFVGQRGELEFDFAPALGSQISVLVEKTTNVNLNTPVVDDCEFSIDDILKKGTYKCSESRRAIVKLRRLLDSTQYNIDESKEAKDVKETFVADLTAAIEEYTKAIDEASENMNTINLEMKKIMAELKTLQADYEVSITELSEKNTKLDEVQKDIISNESSMAEADNTVKLNETLKAAEEARPFPDQSVLDMYNQNIADAKKELEALDAVLAENRDIEKSLQSDISDLEKTVSGLEEDTSNATNEFEERQSALASNKATRTISENNKALASDVKAESESLIEKLSKTIDSAKDNEADIVFKLKAAEEVADEFCSSAESVRNITRSATVSDVNKNTESKVYDAMIGEEPREVKTTGYFNIGVVGDGPKAIATNPPEFELMDENLDIKALNEDGTEMEP
tara:strand:- start:14720 stop:18238 length:3519 start_codon:yes stop_codon:yes gene_type:complete